MLGAQVVEQPCIAYGALPVQVAPSLAPDQPPVPLSDSPPYVAAAGPLVAVDMTVHSIFIASEYDFLLCCLIRTPALDAPQRPLCRLDAGAWQKHKAIPCLCLSPLLHISSGRATSS